MIIFGLSFSSVPLAFGAPFGQSNSVFGSATNLAGAAQLISAAKKLNVNNDKRFISIPLFPIQGANLGNTKNDANDSSKSLLCEKHNRNANGVTKMVRMEADGGPAPMN